MLDALDHARRAHGRSSARTWALDRHGPGTARRAAHKLTAAVMREPLAIGERSMPAEHARCPPPRHNGARGRHADMLSFS
jgi:hypothetical protein